MLQDLQWDGCRKETDYYEKNYGSCRNSNFRDTQMDIKDNSWSVEAGLRTCQNNSSSIRYGGKDISFIRKNGHILIGGEHMQAKGLFLNYKKNRRLIRWKRCTVQQRDNTRQERAARTLGCFFSS